MARAIICDLDGTLCDDSLRHHFAEKQEWDAYNALMYSDKVCTPVYHLLHAMADSGFRIILCTGRFEEYKYVTTNWLAKHEVPYDELIMRPTGDYRRNHEVKQDMMKLIRHDILFVIEDQKTCIDMWRQNGLVALQCQERNY